MTYFLSHKYVLVINFIMISLAVCIIFPYFLGDLITLDMMYQGYNLNEVKHALESYGSQGRLRYFFISRYLDNLLPLIYVLFLIGLIFNFNLDHNTQSKVLKCTLIILSLCVASSDWIENYYVCQILLAYPAISINIVELASCCTKVKWISLTLTSAGIGLITLIKALSYKPYTQV